MFDTIYCEASNNVVNNGAGRATLHGGDGNDSFVFGTALSGTSNTCAA